MAQKNETPALIGATLAVAVLLGGLWWIFKKSDFSIGNSQPETQTIQASAPSAATTTGATPGADSGANSAPSQPGMRPGMQTTTGGTGGVGSFAGLSAPSGQFNYGGSTSWAPIRSSLDASIQSALPQFQLRYVNPNRPIHKFVSQAVQRLQRISLRLFQVERIYLGRRNQGLSIVPISN